MTAPVAAGRRLELVDVLRGFALFGVVVSNVAVFAGAGAVAGPEIGAGAPSGSPDVLPGNGQVSRALRIDVRIEPPAGRMALTNHLAVSVLVTLVISMTGTYGRLGLAPAVGLGALWSWPGARGGSGGIT